MNAPCVTYVDTMDGGAVALEWLEANTGRLAFGTETTGLDVFVDDFEVGVVAFGHRNGNALVLNGRDHALVRTVVIAAFNNRKVWAHQANVDSWAVRKVYALKLTSLRCSLIGSRAAWPGRTSYSLKDLRGTTQNAQDALKVLWSERVGRKVAGRTWLAEAVRDLPANTPALVAYVAEDAVETARLVQQLSEIEDPGTRQGILNEVDTDILWRWAGYDGLHYDVERTERVYSERKALLEKEILHFGFNPTTSSNARKEWVAAHGIELPLSHKTGKPSLDKDARGRIVPPEASREEWNRLARACDEAYLLAKLGEMTRKGDGMYVHPTINTHAAKTGRMSVTTPALQNLAGGLGEDDTSLRGLLLAREGKVLVGCDLSHVEPSVLAAVSGDPLLIKHCAPGMDLYVGAAAAVFGATAGETTEAGILTEYAAKQRKVMKVVVLALMYGMGNTSLAGSLGVSVAEAKNVRSKVLGIYPKVRRWIDQTKKDTERGIVPRTVAGSPLPCLPRRAYVSTNYIIQGSASTIFKTMCKNVAANLPNGASLWLPVHDELVIECDEVVAQEVANVLAAHMRTELNGVLIWGEPEILGTRWRKV